MAGREGSGAYTLNHQRLVRRSRLPPSARLLLLNMLLRADGFTGARMKASVGTLAADTGLAPRSVRRYLTYLHRRHVIALVTHRYGGRNGPPAEWRVDLDRLAARAQPRKNVDKSDTCP